MNSTSDIRILIVDDEAASMRALCDTLEQQGYKTAGFTIARDALQALRGQQFELLLTDLMMPEVDGVQLLSEALQIDPDITGIIMTGQGTIATAVDSLKAGAFDYVLKPLKLTNILPVLSRAIIFRQLRLDKASLEESLRKRSEELEAANRELEAFSYSVSHDLRAPLRAVNGYARMLYEDSAAKLDDEGLRQLAVVRESGAQMGELIDDLLEFSRSGRQPLRASNINMGVLVETVIEQLRLDYPTGRVTIFALPDAVGDPALIKQVLVNLIGNAFKYSEKVGAPLIEIGGQVNGEAINYWIRDNGAGFDMKYYGKLFGVFQRLHDAEQFSGTGVGLAIVQRIITRHGGRVWAESVVGNGATFYFSLPPTNPTVG